MREERANSRQKLIGTRVHCFAGLWGEGKSAGDAANHGQAETTRARHRVWPSRRLAAGACVKPMTYFLQKK